MNSFEAAGEARLLAAEGQRQIAAAIARGLGRMMKRLIDTLGRHLSQGKVTPF